jgi:hypothetical protein
MSLLRVAVAGVIALTFANVNMALPTWKPVLANFLSAFDGEVFENVFYVLFYSLSMKSAIKAPRHSA